MTPDPKPTFASEPAGVETAPERPHEASPANGTAPQDGDSIAKRPLPAGYLWLRRVGVLLFVFLCATIGVMLMIVPWRPEWSENPLLLAYPRVREAISSGFVRGVVSGLGLLNVWIGFWEAIQYRED